MDQDAPFIPPGISRIAVAGFKSIVTEQAIDIKPLTLLAGANSSGKSSIMQPLLLVKQTLESSYNPPVLLMHGPHAKYTDSSQFFARHGPQEMSLRLDDDSDHEFNNLKIIFERISGRIALRKMEFTGTGSTLTLQELMSSDEISDIFFNKKDFYERKFKPHFKVIRQRCFLSIKHWFDHETIQEAFTESYTPVTFAGIEELTDLIKRLILRAIHVPGSRTPPDRLYPLTGVDRIEGSFEPYTASFIFHWQTGKPATLIQLEQWLSMLELTRTVRAMLINETQLELRVGRTLAAPPDEADDLVNIFDVGVGMATVMPVLVALLAAQPGQLVYLEEPELHLHPRAQWRLGSILAQRAGEGVRVVVETHSSILLRGIQTEVAKGHLDPALVSLNWFSRDSETGATRVTPAHLNEKGAFGEEWPVDFDDVNLASAREYLAAVRNQPRPTP